MNYFRKTEFRIWVRAALIRAVKTTAQTAIALIPAAASIHEINWICIVETAILAGIISILTSLLGLPETSGKNKKE